MKRERLLNALTGTLLGLWVAVGSVGCLVTAFGLPLESPGLLLWCGILFAVFCALLLQWKRGGLVLLGLGALAAGYVWYRGFPMDSFASLLSRLTEIYDRAYGWGVFPAAEAASDLPMALAGGLMILTVTRSVCRGTGAAIPLLTAVLLFVPCVVVTDTVPDAPWLFLLGTGLVLLVLTAGVRKTNPVQGDRLAAMAAVPVLLGAGLLFWLNPQETYVNQSKEMQQAMADWVARLPALLEKASISGKADASPQVSLSTLGRRIESRSAVLEVTSDTGGILYLRGRDYDSYDGKGWTATQNRVEIFGQVTEDTGGVTVRTRRREPLLYLPYYPQSPVQIIGGRAKNQDQVSEYYFRVTALPPQDAASRDDAFYQAAHEQLQRYLDLPVETKSGLRAVLNTLALGGSTAETADAIAAYVRNSAKYDLDPSRMPRDATDFVRWFLKDAERGYCVHFASAATVLLRAAGVPARYVTGYMVTAEHGQTVTVTGKNAHAWAEYYDESRNIWVVLEATPPEEREPEPSGGTEPPASTETEPPQSRPTEHRDPGQTTPTLPGGRGPQGKPAADLSWLAGPVYWLLGLAALAAILEAQRQARIRLRRQNRGSPTAQALARWRETVLLAKLLGEEPPRELHQLAQKAKFSQHTLTAEELSRFAAYRRTACRALKERPWYQRLVHQYLFAVY